MHDRFLRLAVCAAVAIPLMAAEAPLARAQSGPPPIPTMPLPPSASDPKPADTKAGPRKPQRTAKPKADPAGEPATRPAPRPRKSSASPSPSGTAGYDRPSRYVPDEFDRGDSDASPRVKPYVNESGRPGMGMRF